MLIIQIPAVIFQKDRTEGTPNEPSRDSRPTSKTHSIRGSVKDKSVKDKSRRSNSQTSTSDNLKITHSRSNSRQSIEPEAEEPEISFKPHKYIIEATVLKESWPLSPANWDFVTKLKETENSELKGKLNYICSKFLLTVGTKYLVFSIFNNTRLQIYI